MIAERNALKIKTRIRNKTPKNILFLYLIKRILLKNDISADYEIDNKLEITLRATDQSGLYIEENFTIDVVNDPSDDPVEYILGTFDNDTLSTGNGSDEVYGYVGDDTINIDGLGSKIIDGGGGADTLNIDVSGITSIDSFSKINLDTSTGFLSFTSNNGDVISVKNIEKLYVNGFDYGDPSSSNPSDFSNINQLFYNSSVNVDGAEIANFFSIDEVGGSNNQNLY